VKVASEEKVLMDHETVLVVGVLLIINLGSVTITV
jgi:hypothetical protein